MLAQCRCAAVARTSALTFCRYVCCVVCDVSAPAPAAVEVDVFGLPLQLKKMPDKSFHCEVRRRRRESDKPRNANARAQAAMQANAGAHTARLLVCRAALVMRPKDRRGKICGASGEMHWQRRTHKQAIEGRSHTRRRIGFLLLFDSCCRRCCRHCRCLLRHACPRCPPSPSRRR